jgi:hypothetical protein
MSKIIIHLGHSNCKGRAPMADLPVAYQTSFSNIKVWNGSTVESLNYATNNNQYPVSQQSNEFGIEFSLLKTLQEEWNETIYYYKYGVGGSKIASDGAVTTWHYDDNGELHDTATSEINKMFDYLWNTLNIRDTYEVYIVQHIGENDGGVESESLAFETNAIDLTQSRIDRFTCTSISLKTIGIIENSINQSSVYRQNILDSYPNIVSAFSGSYSIFSHDMTSYPLQGDGSHYTGVGYIDIGNNIADYIITNDL